MTTPPDRPDDPLDPSRVSPCPILRDELNQRAAVEKRLRFAHLHRSQQLDGHA